MRQEAESTKKARMEGRMKREDRIKTYPSQPNGQPHHNYSRRPHQSERGRQNGRYQPYRQEAYEAYTPQSPNTHNIDKNRKYPRDPNKYRDFHKKLGHTTEDCGSLKREREKAVVKSR